MPESTRSNLINAGILPFVFENPADYDRIASSDSIKLVNVTDQILSGDKIEAIILPSNTKITLNLNLSDREREVLLNAGYLNFVKGLESRSIMTKVTLIPGDGIGPEISQAMMAVVKASGVTIDWEITPAGLVTLEQEGTLFPQRVFDSFERNKIAIKGPLATPIGKGHRSLNVMLRKKYDLYACVRPVRSIAHIAPKFPNVDLVIFRENTEDLYMGIEEVISEDEAHSIKVITRKATLRIAKAAYEYAVKENRKKVTIVTKANIMKAHRRSFPGYLPKCRCPVSANPNR